MSGECRADLDAVRAWLGWLLSLTQGLLYIGSTKAPTEARDDWRGVVSRDLDELVAYVERRDAAGAPGIYLRTTTLTHRPRGRGSASDSHELIGLWADADYGTTGHKRPSRAGTLPLPPDEDSARLLVAESGLPAPTLWVHSGGGLYPWWVLDKAADVRGDLAAAESLSARWQAVLTAAGKRLGWDYGSGVGDLARVLRLPGTINRKEGLERPCRALDGGSGVAYALDELHAAVAAAEERHRPETPPAPAPTASFDWSMFNAPRTGPGPFDILAEVATWADILEPVGWTLVDRDRHGDLWKRPGGASSAYSARVMADGYALVVHSDAAGLPTGVGLTRGQVFAHYHHQGDESAAASDLIAAARGDATASAAARALPGRALDAIARARPAAASSAALPTLPAADEAPASTTTGGGSSWARVDLTDILNGNYDPPVPTVGMRADGAGLLYPGRLHSFAAEPEAGKTWVALGVAASELAAGNGVLFLDFEDEPGAVVGRLVAIGADVDAIRDRFAYVRPTAALDPVGGAALDEMASAASFAVIDGVTEAMSLHGLKPKDDVDVARFWGLLPRRLARRGPAVLMLDHVVKDTESRGRWATGSQHKLAGLDGAAYSLENVAPIAPGAVGRTRLYVAKDRPGGVRRNSLPVKNGRAWWADVVIDSHSDGTVTVTFEPPAPETGAAEPFRPTTIMQKISDALSGAAGPLSTRDIRSRVNSKATTVDTALARLVDEGFVTVATRGNARMHTLTKPFTNEPSPWDALASGDTVSRVPSVSQRVPDATDQACPRVPPYKGDAGRGHDIHTTNPRNVSLADEPSAVPEAVIAYVTANPGVSASRVADGTGLKPQDVTPALDEAVSSGALVAQTGARGARLHYPAAAPADPSAVPWDEMGPCARCGTQTHRYGRGTGPLCAACRAADQPRATA